METLTWTLIGAVAIVVISYDFWKKSFFKRKGIPCERPLPFIGHYHKMLTKGLIQVTLDMGKHPSKVHGLFLGSPFILIHDPEILKEVMVRNFSHFYNRTLPPFDDYPLNKALTALQGSRWRKVRNTITPAFSASKMKPIAALLNDSCDSLIKHMRTKISIDPDVEVKKIFGNMTMDCIAKGGFGIQVDSQENPDSPFVKNARAFVDINFYNPFLILSIFLPQIGPICNYFDVGLIANKAKKFFVDVTQQAMHIRQDEEVKRVDILQLMVNAHKTNEGSNDSEDIPEIAGEDSGKSNKTDLTDAEIIAQTLLFFLAGYDTTNIALSLAAYSLATHPEVQERLFQEIQEKAPDRDSVNYDTVNKMEYLDMVLSETLRCYPPASVVDRVCQEPITIGKYHFEKGQQLFVNIMALHHDPDQWEDPEKFDPERFTKEAKEARNPFSYLPFGTGPRNCIGMRFAMLVLKTALVRMVQNFKFEPCEKTDVPIKMGKVNPTPDKGITLRVTARE
ncbi:cytochrome P450 3A11-like [Apostichopus japonicus]|uniref:cytochrome P450 3A11-like n=1 Tax=Stichopus japonicus TaxID=307972 RepID=UPI003AB647B5